jgi:chromosome segregation ATPase
MDQIKKFKTDALEFVKKNLVIILVLFVLGFLLGNGCGSGSVNRSKVDQAEVNVLLGKLNDSANALAGARHAADRLTQRYQQAVDSLGRLSIQSRERARKAQQNASYWEGVAKQADEVKDCETGIEARDSVISEQKTVIEAMAQTIQLADSTISVMSQENELLEDIKEKQAEFIDQQHTVITKLNAENTQQAKEIKDYRKDLKRKKFWGKAWNGVKVGLAAVAGFAVGSIIK